MKESFNSSYYEFNKQNKDRIGNIFYYNVIKSNFDFKSYLDYGCGLGFLLKRVEKDKKIKTISGYDINKFAIHQSRKNTSRSVIYENIEDIKNKFDLISILHIIEHIDDDNLKDTFSKIKRLLNKDGNLLIATPAKNALAHNLKKNSWIGYKDKTHINLKTKNEWVAFFKNENFDIIKISNDGLWDNFYGQFTFSLKFIKIFLIMIFQIFTGKLTLSYYEGETFIFILKKND